MTIKNKYNNINLIGAMNNNLIDYSWSINFDHAFKHKPKPFTRPRIKQIYGFIGTGLRLMKFVQKCKKKNILPNIDFFNSLECKQIYGAPIGGIGTGSIGRTFTGDFCRFQLVPGLYEHQTAEANMFTVNIRKKSESVYQQSLTVRSSKLKGFKNWNLEYPGELGIYYVLYPESWSVYNLPDQNVVLTCHQLSPIIPHNYKDSSLPVALFSWTAENNNDEEIELALMFTWQSGSASNKFELKDVKSKSFNDNSNDLNVCGVALSQKLKNMALEYCIAAKKTENCEITYNCQFYPDNEQSGTQLWLDLLNNGKLTNNEFKTETKDLISSKMAIAVCVNVKVKPFSKENIEFSLVWNMPQISFPGDSEKIFNRYYTRYFPAENPNSSIEITSYSLANKSNWLTAINDWREPILKNKNLPNFYKCCLFNELYFISDGGTLWVDINKEDTCSNSLIKEYGRFAYLEGHEYRMYNTYDVHFYASFALIKLWPKLQLSLQYDYAETIIKESDIKTNFIFNGETGIQKSKNCIPHDLGDPYCLPWQDINSYIIHDTKNWKDLNLKFILSVYRDYYHLKDKKFLEDMWPLIKPLLITIQSQDSDNDGLVDSQGEPDQTYDAWSTYGASAYCGGLHVATLQIVCEIAKLLEDSEALSTYSEIFKKAKESYDTKLWNGKYYKYDSSKSDYSNSIMSDMCCGHWFLRSSGLNYEAFESDKIKSCLETIFEFNVMKYADGKRGAVNGMRPNGEVDTTSVQSEEMWIGVTDSLAALMIYENMPDKAWKSIEGMYNLCYNQLGLAFQMPEAILKSNVFRSLGYMRPLCIWAIQYAIENKSNNESSSEESS